MTTTIRQQDLIDSIAAALQYISYYHPADYIAHLARAYEGEASPAAKDAIAQILTNSRMCAEGRRPICQDTGIVNVFLKIGMDVRFEGFSGSIEDAVNEGVRRGYLNPDNVLRASIVADPQVERKNTKDNTPAVVHMNVVPGSTVDVQVAAKGGGSENKSKFVMLNPSDSLVDWVMKTVPTMGAGWCPPGMLGIGIGGTAEKAMLMAKEVLMDPIDMFELKARGPKTKAEELRIELCDKINALGIGAQGLGGLTTVLDVKIAMHATPRGEQAGGHDPQLRRHAPRALRTRRQRAGLYRPAEPGHAARRAMGAGLQEVKKVDLNTLTRKVAAWKPGDTLLLNGPMLTGRDAAQSASRTCLAKGEKLPVDWPTASSTTSARSIRCAMRWWARLAHHRHAHGQVHRNDAGTDGMIGMIGKAERGPTGIAAIKKHKSAYLMAVGGAAYLVAKAIQQAKVVGFADLGMEAIYEFDVKDMPVTVAVASDGTSVHETGPKEWQAKIGKIPVVTA